MKIPNKRKFQQIAINRSSNIEYDDFMNPCKKYAAEGCSFSVTDTTPVTDNPLRFTMNVLERA